MSRRGRPPKNKLPNLEDLPEKLRFSIIKLMANMNIKDVKTAYDQKLKIA